MKKRLIGLLFALAASVNAATLTPLAPLPQQTQAASLTAQIFSRYHYKATPLDSAMSEKIFERYLKALDPDKLFFLQADIDQFAAERAKLGEGILRQDLHAPFDIFNRYEQRIVERLSYARELLKQDFDFTQKEVYQLDREKGPWSKSEDELRDIWRKRVKNDWLQLKLAGKDDKAIREALDKRYAASSARAYKFKSDDVFQVFMNAYANAIEPHTDYFGPKVSEEFDISMRLSLFGIGAVLQEKDEYTTIRELVPGGPAAQSGGMKAGDRIVGVGQGKDGPVTDVVGWRIDDVVRLIRGAKDTVVRLDILPADAGPDGKHKLLSLVRDKISLDKQAARKSVIQLANSGSNAGGASSSNSSPTRKIGVITLPTFYQDFEASRKGEKEFKSATRDVARLVEDLKKEKVEGIVIDLRNNGGGSLTEAVELTGLFIGKGPVVQERTSQGKVNVETGNNAKRAWDGPLAVLINRGSASASEIFAAAIQDYGRGVILGEPSFGKGTVQTVLNLDQMAHNDKPKLGEVKMTIAQFFRVNGGTTQLRGVTPDIGFPSFSDPETFGESSYENALPWTQIKAADYTPLDDLSGLLPTLKTRHTARVAKDKNFQYLIEDIAELNVQRKKRAISLNVAERRKQREEQDARLKLRAESGADGKPKKVAKPSTDPAKKDRADGVDPLGDESDIDDPLAAEKSPDKDFWLKEAANIVGDQADIGGGRTKSPAPVVSGARSRDVAKADR